MWLLEALMTSSGLDRDDLPDKQSRFGLGD